MHDERCKVQAQAYGYRKRIGQGVLGACVDVEVGQDAGGTPFVHASPKVGGSCTVQ
jgi:hypothetical protein